MPKSIVEASSSPGILNPIATERSSRLLGLIPQSKDEVAAATAQPISEVHCAQANVDGLCSGISR